MDGESGHYAELLQAVGRGESLPPSWYTDPAITTEEIERIFRRAWQYVGPLNELANQGDYITGLAGGVPVVVVRNETGLAGFVNVCRHRRHLVLKGRGNVRVMQCAYHAWTYDLSGCLKGAPRSEAEPGFRMEDYPLLPIRAEALGPFVFVNLDPEARSAAETYSGILELIESSGINLSTLELYRRDEWESYSNWKTMLENYLECYHCAVAHPGFSAAIDVKPENYRLTEHEFYSSQVGHVRASALEGRSQVKIYDARGELEQAQYHLLWPNFTININPGFPNLSVDVWRPNGANGTKGFSEQYFAPGVTQEFAEDLIAFNRQVGEEDDLLTDAVQTGLMSGLPKKGRFLVNAEHLAVHFQKLVVNALAGRTEAIGARDSYVQMEVTRVEEESEGITSFHLRRADGAKLPPWEPGQFLPIRVSVPGEAQPALRTYTISDHGCDEYRLSIKREAAGAMVSNYFHGQVRPGGRLEAMRPRGKFVLDRTGNRPVALISAGVGITPMIAMVNALASDGGRSAPVYFIHGVRNGRAHAFGAHLRQIAARHSWLKPHIRYSRPSAGDSLGTTHDSEGHVGIDLVKRIVLDAEADFYLCGPAAFMQALYDGLREIGVPRERIHYESFGPATVLKHEHAAGAKPGAAADGAIPVRFTASGVAAEWTRDTGTLLELAEAAGLAPVFGCRSGICGTCITRLESGSVEYLEEPVAPLGAGEVLLCCSVPQRAADGSGVVLRL